MARAVMPMFSASCGWTRMITGPAAGASAVSLSGVSFSGVIGSVVLGSGVCGAACIRAVWHAAGATAKRRRPGEARTGSDLSVEAHLVVFVDDLVLVLQEPVDRGLV